MQQRGDDFKALKILHLALLGGVTLLAVIALLMQLGGFQGEQDKSLNNVLQVVAAVLSTGTLLVGFNLFRKKIALARESLGAAEKRMELYRAACIFWWAMIELPGIFAVIGFILIGNYAFLALGLFHIVILAVFMPRKENIILLLNLTSDEVAKLEGKK